MVPESGVMTLEEVRGAFLSKMSHDLRNPLNAILGLSEVLQEGVYGDLTDRQLRSLKQIETSGLRLLVLIERFMLVQRIVEGQLQIRKSSMNPGELLTVMKRSWASQIAHHEVVMEVVCDPSLGLVESDIRLVRELISPLIENAVHATPPGKTIRLEARRLSPARWVVLVSNEVAELEPDTRAKIESIVAAPEDIRFKLLQAKGLGLPIASALSELLGGEMSVVHGQTDLCLRVDLPG
jgi:signal transduction histidine kinase